MNFGKDYLVSKLFLAIKVRRTFDCALNLQHLALSMFTVTCAEFK